MILETAETVSGYFRFNRIVCGNKKSMKTRKQRSVQDPKEEREKEYHDSDNRKPITLYFNTCS
jgi:hypothetical protein